VLLGGVWGSGAGAQVISSSSIPRIDGEDGQVLPNRLEGQVGIVENLGGRVSTDLRFRNEQGDDVALASLMEGNKPVVLAFVYHNCPMLCSLVLDGVAEAVAASDLRPGQDYELLAVSIDPTDTPARARAAKERVVEMLGDSSAAAGLHFWTVTPETESQVRQLADEVGFRYARDARTGEYAHHAVLTFLSPLGVVTRYLYGIQFPERDFRLSVVEAGEGTVGTVVDRFLLTCYEYDDDAQSYSLAVLGLLKWGGGLTLLLFVGGMAFLWRREMLRQASALPPGTPPLSVS
jgi:protein SCO1/2